MLPLLVALLQPPAAIPRAEDVYPPADPTVRLPHPEPLLRVGPRSFAVRPAGGGWTLFAGAVPVRDFGPDRQAADDAVRLIGSLMKLTAWGTVGGRVPLDYAVADGRAAPTAPTGRFTPIDLRSVRAEAVRGAAVLRDDTGLLVNFGADPAAAEQAAAICRRYGFNRLLTAGPLRLLAAGPVTDQPPPAADPLTAAMQVQNLDRSGIPLPGGGFAGERLALDPRKLEVRRDRTGFSLAHGADVLATFGGDDGAAREALRVIRDDRLTDFCAVGGLTFFLSNGRPPTRVPFAARGTPLRADRLAVVPADGRFAVTDGGKPLTVAATEAEAELVREVVKAFGFDTVCRLGAGSRGGLTLLLRTGR